MRFFVNASALAISAGLAAYATPASAQDAPDPASAKRVAAKPAAEADNPSIIVTGSRVARNGNSSPTPVTTVTTDKLNDLRPSTIADQLNTLPVFNGSRQTTSFGRGTGLTGGGNGAANQLNLRNVGTNRDLILMDGIRVPPSTSQNVVDADVVPQMLVQRVDVVTGGVSAVYGSDAISGVVNFIMDHKLEGFKFQADTGISKYGDDATYNGGIAWGKSFNDGRGHFEFSYEHRADDGVLSRASRPWFTQASVGGAGTAASPGVTILNGRLNNFPFGGKITCNCSLSGQYFSGNGTLSAFQNGAAVTNAAGTISGIQVGGNGGYYDSSLKSPLNSHQMFGRFDYDLSDHVHWFAYGSANIKNNLSYVQNFTITGASLASNNPFLTAAQQSALSAGGSTFALSGIYNNGETREGYHTHVNQYIAVTGLQGDVGKVKWDLTYNYGYSVIHTAILNDVNQQHLAAALDATTDGSGNIVCRSLAQNPGCVAFNPFGSTAASQAALSYVLQQANYDFKTRQDDVVASANGSPFRTWAGDVTLAASGEWRQIRAYTFSDATPDQMENCAGITASRNCSATTAVWRQSFAQGPAVSQGVWEGSVEAELPLVKDVHFIKNLSLNGAARYTDYYDTVGSYWTWKGGFSWEVSDELRLRGTISRDIRAPTLSDLYSPRASSNTTQQDLLTNTNPNVPFVQLGNPNLKAEIGHTKTFGAVWKPNFFRGFSLAVDYYDIKITNAITQVSGVTSSIQQICYASGGTSPYCAFQSRPNGFGDTSAANTVTAWYNQPLNIGALTTYGIDFEGNYAGRLLDRPFTARVLTAWQPHIRYIQPGLPTFDMGDTAFGPSGQSASPSWRITATTSYQLLKPLRVDLEYRWRNPMKISSDPTYVWAPGQGTVGAYGQAAINLSFQVPDKRFEKLEFFLNIQNLFNANPQAINSTGSSGSPGFNNGWALTDDPIGRYYTIGLRGKF